MKNIPVSVTHKFKISIVIIVFFLALFRLLDILYLPAFNPAVELVSDKALLIIVIFVLVYLWVQETRDYYNLLRLNKDLTSTREQLEQAQIESITALMKAEESKDPYTYGHSDRVTKLALAIAGKMNLGDDFKKVISRAGLLHDIGKIGIQDAVLLKQEKLTDAEWEIIKSHSQQGAKILEPLKFLAREREIILYHHERYDGKGYPGRLMGEEIPLGSQILAVADAFDAMNSQRPYRQAMERDAIIAELRRCRGTQHKSQITDVLLQLLEEKPELWNK